MAAKQSAEIASGWCMTQHHEGCTEFYLTQEYNRGCVCACHVDTTTGSK